MKNNLLPIYDSNIRDNTNEFDFKQWSELIHSKDIVSQVIKITDYLYTRTGLMTGLPTGFKELDQLDALKNGNLIIIGGRPSMGKSALASWIVENIARQTKSNVAYFSLDLSRQSIMQRMLCSRARIDTHKVRSGYLSSSDWPHLIKAAEELREVNIFIDDTSSLPLQELREKALWLKNNRDIKLLVVDTIQLLHEFIKAGWCPKKIEKIARSLKALAVELNIPVVVLSQLSDVIDSRENHRPMMIDLPGAGSMGRCADVVLFLFREEYYVPTDENRGNADIIIAKINDGPGGMTRLIFRRDFFCFESSSYWEGLISSTSNEEFHDPE